MEAKLQVAASHQLADMARTTEQLADAWIDLFHVLGQVQASIDSVGSSLGSVGRAMSEAQRAKAPHGETAGDD